MASGSFVRLCTLQIKPKCVRDEIKVFHAYLSLLRRLDMTS